ncbi:UDP-3-O-acyl-N-acetylglucosamine deacetylase [Dinoroseobacter sp. PD6]|uniref:UDP-3-O-acyl-N-acetylglucosamine deacetylase n=1 Tax=Dinoroseobacter sp. PD6 TaxID=3028384 RepID=UPI00237B080D|nr:UDP-3-O-acyl-N-acetylglucosamine deacetylase [Dinoroseobacter sp. PD6]MDD9716335.1 UDP-3-O-acyl-N-acetylglucosamine deacetylase [Dinoroseobacter sp. PD6]
MQKTLKSKVVFEGVGLHSGAPVRMVVHPASAEYGIWFKRTDILAGDNFVAARWDQVERTPLCTKLRNDAGMTVSTVEHVMAALSGCGIYNALIELNGPEVPILDGSSAEFVAGFLAAGIRDLSEPSRLLRILKPVEVRDGLAMARLDPAPGFELRFHIDFVDSAIGDQSKRLSMANGTFVRELCDSRTFCRQSDVDAMHAQGLALGGTYDNAVVVDGARVLSPGGFRHPDEAVRHKMLDAVGDLALAGAPIFGRYTGERAGHTMTNTLLRALFADPSSYVVETCSRAMAARLPGSGLHRTDLRLVA